MTDTTDASPLGADITAEKPVVVLGGGPAGLTAGYLLAKQGKSVVVLESTDMVGGIARTEVRDGYRLERGGQRFRANRGSIGTRSSSSTRSRAWT